MNEDDKNRVCRGCLESGQMPVISKVTTMQGAQEVAVLAREIWQQHYTPLIGAQQVAYMLDRFQSADRIWQDICNGQLTYSKLEQDGRPIGYMAVRLDLIQASCFLSKIYIKDTFRGRGFARLFLDRLIEECRALGIGQIWLTVNKGNSGSIAAYQKMGFSREEAIVTDIGNGFVMDDYVMRLDLAMANAPDLSV